MLLKMLDMIMLQLAVLIFISIQEMNEGSLIHDRNSFLNYAWPDADSFDYSKLSKIENELPDGMKLIVYGLNGILENVIDLIGYENLCYMTFEERDLVKGIFDNVGIRIV